jgi:hypothetical protein
MRRDNSEGIIINHEDAKGEPVDYGLYMSNFLDMSSDFQNI